MTGTNSLLIMVSITFIDAHSKQIFFTLVVTSGNLNAKTEVISKPYFLIVDKLLAQ